MTRRVQCPAITREGKPCPINGELRRGCWCHVHDPRGRFQQAARAAREGATHDAP